MILLCGIPSEGPLRMVIDAARRAGVDHLVVNQREAGDHELTIEVGSSDDGGPVRGELRVGSEKVDLGEVDGVYVRMTEVASLPENRGRRSDRVERSLACDLLLREWFEIATCRVANRISSMGSNASKPFQAQLIEQVGFATPATVVTNQPDQVHAFARAHESVIYKSTSSVRSIVKELDADALARVDRVRALPTQFQARERGTDVRVHVVGPHVIATRATTHAVDYRYAGRDGAPAQLEPVELPPEIAHQCVVLAENLDLPFCGIDLLERDDGSWACFEVNPSPGFSYFEAETGQPISDTLVAWLDGG